MKIANRVNENAKIKEKDMPNNNMNIEEIIDNKKFKKVYKEIKKYMENIIKENPWMKLICNYTLQEPIMEFDKSKNSIKTINNLTFVLQNTAEFNQKFLSPEYQSCGYIYYDNGDFDSLASPDHSIMQTMILEWDNIKDVIDQAAEKEINKYNQIAKSVNVLYDKLVKNDYEETLEEDIIK